MTAFGRRQTCLLTTQSGHKTHLSKELFMALYHYCPNEAFHSIISNREIRLSSLSLSNDYMEGKLVEKGILKIAEEDRLNMDQMEGLKGALTYISSTADGLGFCLSEKKDLLSQWRGYANDANGVSIGFSKNYLELLSNSLRDDKTPRFTLNQVIYKPDEIASVLNPTYQKIKEHIDKGAFKRPVYPGLLSIRPKEEYEKMLGIPVAIPMYEGVESLVPMLIEYTAQYKKEIDDQ